MSCDVQKNERKDLVVFDLNVLDGDYKFATSIVDAMNEAELEIQQLNETIDSLKNLKPDCDRLDYALAASSGVLCGVIDIFLVGKPGESPLGDLTDKWFDNRIVDFAKLLNKGDKDTKKIIYDKTSALKYLEEKFEVPYDQIGLNDAGKDVFGLRPINHHFKSLAHNPSLLGLFFSILDQFKNTSHFVSNGQLIILEQAKTGWKLKGTNIPSKIFCGFINWFGHIVSDMSGSSNSAKNGTRGMGIPSPLWTWTNDIIAIKSMLNINVTEFDKTMNELSLKIFEKGFDARFQTAQTIPVFINEILVRSFYSIRRLLRYYQNTEKEERCFSLMWKSCEPFSNLTVKRMLTVAHGTFCLVDVGDATVRGFVAGGGSFNPVEFFLRLNVAGIGRFTISLYGEAKGAIAYNKARKEADFAKREITIVEDYICGLKFLYDIYDDEYLLTFVDDFKKKDSYKEGFNKTVQLARKRGVPEDKILKNKSEIDKYFGGN